MAKAPDFDFELAYQALIKTYRDTSGELSRAQMGWPKEWNYIPDPDIDLILDKERFEKLSAKRQEIEEYRFAVKRLKRLLSITPEVTIRTKLQPYQAMFPKGEFPIRPVRKIPKSALRVTGVNPNTKGSYPAAWESRLEGNYLTYLDFTQAVAYYLPQPLTLEWEDAKGKKHTYTPDVFILWAQKGEKFPRPWLVEVKYKSDFDQRKEEYAPKFAAATKYAKERDWEFHTISERDIPPIYLQNILFLKRYRHLDTTEAAVAIAQKLISHLFEMETSTVQNLINSAFDDETNRMLGLGMIWRLVVAREIMVDLNEPLTNNSILWLPDKYFDDILDPETYRK